MLSSSRTESQGNPAAAPQGSSPGGEKLHPRWRLWSGRWHALASWQRDFLLLLLIAAFVSAAFFNTLVFGKSISRLCRLAERDTIFTRHVSGVRDLYDSSVYQEHVPNYFLVANLLNSGHLPLWNSYSECGTPLLADVQSMALSPLRLAAAPLASLRFYNVSLVIDILIAALATYGLARAIGLRRYAALFASPTYAFCPYVLFSLELGYSHGLIPLLLLAFVHLGKAPGFPRASLAGASAALVILSGHPEISFFGISLAGLLMVLTALFRPEAGPNLARRSTLALGFLLVAAAVAFCLSAPVLVPFAEYLGNADCFKAMQAHLRYTVPWQGPVLSLLHPGFGPASPFLGAVAAALIPLSLLAAFRRGGLALVGPVALTAVTAFLVVCRAGTLDEILSHPPLTWLMTEYALSPALALCALLAAIGLQELLSAASRRARLASLLLMLAGAATVAVTPAVVRLVQLPLDAIYINTSYIKGMTLSTSAWTRDTLLLAPVVLLSFIGWQWGLGRTLAIVPAALVIALNFASEGTIAKKSLPIEPDFQYSAVEPLPFLQACGERMINMGRHAFVPNTNLVYGIADLLTFNPLHPARTLTFLQNAGVSVEGVNQFADGRLSRLVDLASARYVLSTFPVLGEDDRLLPLPGEAAWIVTQQKFSGGLTVSRCDLRYDTENHDVIGQVRWSVPAGRRGRYRWNALTLADDGSVIWIGDQRPLDTIANEPGSAAGSELAVSELGACVPVAMPPGSRVAIAIQVLDTATGTIVAPAGRDASKPLVVAELVTVEPVREHSPRTGERRFRLVSESARERVRVYENLHALPQAYAVSRCSTADSGEEALRTLSSASFDPRREVVLEGGNAPALEAPATDAAPGVGGSGAGNTGRVDIRRPGPSTVELTARLDRPGFVVLTDTFYPGWRAFIDGIETPVMRANYLFRAVACPAGEHHIQYRYQPASFSAGLALFGAGVILLVWACSSHLYHRRRGEGGEDG